MTKQINKVSPGNGVDFSRIRKYGLGIKKFDDGGSVPDWYKNLYPQNQKLQGWKSGMSTVKAGDPIKAGGVNSSNHGKAEDLTAAFAGNQQYTSNATRVGNDIRYWMAEYKKANPNATPQQAVAEYNKLAKSIRDYQTKSHKNQELGATSNNKIWSGMFHSRSYNDDNSNRDSDAAYLGYDPGSEDIYASTSFLRRMDRYKKEFTDLSESEKVLRTHSVVNWGDIPEFKVYKKANGDLGLLDENGNPIEDSGDTSAADQSTDVTQEEVVTATGQPATGENSDEGKPAEEKPAEEKKSAGGNPNEEDPNAHKPIMPEFDPFTTRKVNLFTDPLYNGATLGLSLMNNKRVKDLAMQQKFPLQSFTPLYDVVQGDYTYQKAYQAAAADRMSRAAAAAASTSNGDQAYAYQKEAADQLLAASKDAALHESQMINQEIATHQKIQETNKQTADAVANANRQSLAAAYNSQLNALATQSLKNTEAIQDNILKNRASYGQWLQNQRLQDYSDWQAQQAVKVMESKQAAWKKYIDSQDIYKFDEGFNSVLTGYNTAGAKDADGPYLAYYDWATGQKLDPKKLETIKKYYKFNASDPIFATMKEQFAEIVAKSLQDYQANVNAIDTEWARIQAQYKPVTFDNQGWRWLDYAYIPPQYTRTLKVGGKVTDRFLQYLEHNRLVQNKNTDTVMEASREQKKLLKQDLESIDRETLLLLRSIFK